MDIKLIFQVLGEAPLCSLGRHLKTCYRKLKDLFGQLLIQITQPFSFSPLSYFAILSQRHHLHAQPIAKWANSKPRKYNFNYGNLKQFDRLWKTSDEKATQVL